MSAVEDYLNSKRNPELAVEELAGEKLLKKNSPGLFMQLLDILDRPGNATRALLVGKLGGLKGLIPFAQTIEDLTGIDIALNKEDRVAGTEVIESLFGKQKQVAGKIDPVDVMGLLVEIVADPLWLVGGIGAATKVGKAKTLVNSALKGAKGNIPKLSTLGTAIRAAKQGKPITGDLSKQLAKAIRTTFEKGGTASMGKTWGQQAARGERAALSILGRPVIKGQRALDAADKSLTWLKKTELGSKFVTPLNRVSSANQRLAKIGIDEKALGSYNTNKELQALARELDLMGEIGDKDEIAKIATDYLEQSIGAAKTPMMVRTAQGKLAKQFTPQIQKRLKDIAKTKARIATQEKNLLKAKSARSQSHIKGRISELVYKNKQKENALKSITKKFNEAVSDKTAYLTTRGQQLQQGADALLSQIPAAKQGQFKEIIDRFAARNESILASEKAVKIPVSNLDRQLGYSRRFLSEDAGKFLADKNMTDRFLARGRELKVRAGSQRKRGSMGSMTRDEIQKVFKDIGFEGEVFDPNLVKSTFARTAQSEASKANARTILNASKEFGKTRQYLDDMVKAGKANPADWVNLQDVMERTGLKVQKEYVGKVIPKEVAQALLKMQEVTSSPESLAGFWKLYTGATQYMKGSLTQFFPAYHGRNAVTNMFNNWLAGVQNPLSYITATRLQSAAAKSKKLAKKLGISFDDAAKQIQWPTVNGMKGNEFWKIADQHAILGESSARLAREEMAGRASDILNTQAKGLRGMASRHLKGADKVSLTARGIGTTVEDNARLAHFIEKNAAGFNFSDAAASTKKYLFDYSDLTQFEKKYMRDRGFYFYTWSRKNLPLQIETLINQPAKQAVFSHLAGGTPRMQGEGMFDRNQEVLNIPLPFRDEEGKQWFISGTGLPIEEAFGSFAGAGTGMFNRVSKVASRQLGKLNPFLRAPMEIAFKKNLYFGNDIRNPADWVQQQLPTSRFRSTIRRATGPDTTLQKVSRIGVGANIEMVDPVKQKAYKLKQIAQDYLDQNKNAKIFKTYYPKDKDSIGPLMREALNIQKTK